MRPRKRLVVVVVSIPRGGTQGLAVTKPRHVSKRWLLANGTRCTNRAVVTAARVVADAVNPESMGVANIAHLAEFYGGLVPVLVTASSQAES